MRTLLALCPRCGEVLAIRPNLLCEGGQAGVRASAADFAGTESVQLDLVPEPGALTPAQDLEASPVYLKANSTVRARMARKLNQWLRRSG